MNRNDQELLVGIAVCALSLHAAWGEQSDPTGTASDASCASKQAHKGQTLLPRRHFVRVLNLSLPATLMTCQLTIGRHNDNPQAPTMYQFHPTSWIIQVPGYQTQVLALPNPQWPSGVGGYGCGCLSMPLQLLSGAPDLHRCMLRF